MMRSRAPSGTLTSDILCHSPHPAIAILREKGSMRDDNIRYAGTLHLSSRKSAQFGRIISLRKM